jgi:hypothetical protein
MHLRHRFVLAGLCGFLALCTGFTLVLGLYPSAILLGAFTLVTTGATMKALRSSG